MSLGFGVLIALLLLVVPGAIVALAARLTWPVAVAVGPALTYGVVGLAIIPFGALGIPWNALTALVALVVVIAVAVGLRMLLARYRDRDAEARAVSLWPALAVAAACVLGRVADRSSRPARDAALAVDPEHLGLGVARQQDPVHPRHRSGVADPHGRAAQRRDARALYYPSAFHALGAVSVQLTGAAPTTAYTLSSLAAAVWLFPVSAAMLTWQLLRPRTSEWRTAGAAAAAAALSASFTAVPYVEFDTASMPNMAAYGIAVPAMVLITSTLRHRDRIPLAVLALMGVFSVHTTGGVVVVLFVVAWWLFDALWRPVRGRLADFVDAAASSPCRPWLLLLPQFLGVLQQAEIIAGHAFVTHEGRSGRCSMRSCSTPATSTTFRSRTS